MFTTLAHQDRLRIHSGRDVAVRPSGAPWRSAPSGAISPDGPDRAGRRAPADTDQPRRGDHFGGRDGGDLAPLRPEPCGPVPSLQRRVTELATLTSKDTELPTRELSKLGHFHQIEQPEAITAPVKELVRGCLGQPPLSPAGTGLTSTPYPPFMDG